MPLPERGRKIKPRSRPGQPRDNEDRVQKELKRLGYKKTPGSGNLSVKGDHVHSDMGTFVVEDKATTDARSMSLKAGWLSKNFRTAHNRGRHSVLVVGFNNMEIPVEKDYALLPLSLFVEMVELLGGKVENFYE